MVNTTFVGRSIPFFIQLTNISKYLILTINICQLFIHIVESILKSKISYDCQKELQSKYCFSSKIEIFIDRLNNIDPSI